MTTPKDDTFNVTNPDQMSNELALMFAQARVQAVQDAHCLSDATGRLDTLDKLVSHVGTWLGRQGYRQAVFNITAAYGVPAATIRDELSGQVAHPSHTNPYLDSNPAGYQTRPM